MFKTKETSLYFNHSYELCLTHLVALILTLIFWFNLTAAEAGDRLLATGGVTQIEGAGGGGLVPWALITGYGTRDQVGVSSFYTQARTRGGFEMKLGGASVGFNNRVEISLSQIQLGLSNTVPGETIKLDTLGAKVRLLGDAIYDQENWVPQVSVGMQVKHNEDFDFIPQAIGAKKASGVDFYLAASKLYMAAVNGRNLLVNFTLQATKANQFGLLGFGGDKNGSYRLEPAFSSALMLTDSLFVGAEYRAKPDNIALFKEESAKDVFVAWFPHRNLALTAAYVDLGNIANKENQTAWYLSGQLSY